MKISAKTEYACIAMLELAMQHKSEEPVRIREIAERHGVPPRFLVQILLQLKGAGLVTSVRGAAGGYHLLLPPEDISLGRVMEVIEGKLEEDAKSSSASLESPIVRVLWQAWNDVTAAQYRVLRGLTLADLIEQAKSQNDPMYHI
jgi:Rrf2 family cysteine metabolism transcriptional repressor